MVEIPKDKDLFVIIDSNALIHRAYHAYPSTLTLPDGTQVNAVYGFSSLLLEVLNKFKPKYVICAFDSKKPTIRHSMYSAYKGTRKKTDSELIDQFPLTYEVVEALNIPLYKFDGFEADDIIGTLVNDPNVNGNVNKLIVTGDHDLLQLVNDHTYIYMAGTSFSKSKVYDEEEVKRRYGFGPEFIVDFKAIKGDTSDNIPGVAGIGDKGATDLILKYGHLDKIYENIENITGRNKQKLIDSQEEAFLSKELATIFKDTPLNFKLPDAKLNDFNKDEVVELFQRFRFRSLINKIPESKRVQLTSNGTDQPSLFGGGAEEKKEFKKIENSKDLEEVINFVGAELFIEYFDNDENAVNLRSRAFSFVSEDKVYLVSETVLKDNLDIFEELLKKPERIVVYKLKSFYNVLKNLGLKFDIESKSDDIMLMSYLLMEGEGKNELRDIAFTELGQVLKDQKELYGAGRDKKTYDEITIETIEDYLVQSVVVVKDSFEILKSKLDSNSKLKKLYRDIELPTCRILADIEYNGIVLDIEYLKEYKADLIRQIEETENKVYESVGHEFNLSSPKQVGDVLFGELNLPGGKKTKTGGFSTNERVLREVESAHPVVSLILKYRELEKLRSTYTDALIDKVDEKTNRIHAHFNQAVTSSGRLSSSDPNLQNIPTGDMDGMKIRKAFIAPKSRTLVALDISQQELRVVANLAGEDNLKEAFLGGVDVHTLTASKMFNLDVDKVDKKHREIGKTLNYSLLYGISAYGLADRLKVPVEEAFDFINKFWDAYPNIEKFFDKFLNDAKKNGYAETYFGRRRSAANLNSSNFRIKEAAKRELVNFPIQGSSADLMKLAMIAVERELSKFKELNPLILLQVHDELVIEIDGSGDLKEFAEAMAKVMESVVEFEIPISVDYKIGQDWSEIK